VNPGKRGELGMLSEQEEELSEQEGVLSEQEE